MGGFSGSPPRLTDKIPSIVDPEDLAESELTDANVSIDPGPEPDRRPYIVGVAGPVVGRMLQLEMGELVIGRGREAQLRVSGEAISRRHATIIRDGHDYFVHDLGSANGTFINGRRVADRARLRDGDKIRVGPEVVFKFALHDEIDEKYQQLFSEAVGTGKFDALSTSTLPQALPWTPHTWRSKPIAQNVTYDDPNAVEAAFNKLRSLPPLVSSWEIEELRSLIAEAQEGRRFLLQGGDCAETFDDCESGILTNKLKILIQMSLVLIHGAKRPVVRVGRFAGQYAKPRSKPTEVRNGVELPSYFGDLVNRPAFTAEARRPDPQLLVTGYLHATATLNYVRSMSGGGFSDLRRPEYFDMKYFERAELPQRLKGEYARMCAEITEGLNLLQSVGDRNVDELMKVKFFTSHEALSLLYESAQTRTVPRRNGFYDLTTHMPWIGERTRALDGAHVEFFRGIVNPVGVKIGPTAKPEEVAELCDVLNPANEPGKIVLITRMGVKNVKSALPAIVEAIASERKRVLWVCDPMHGNAILTRSGVKTRNFDDILEEVHGTMDVHRELGTHIGGVHFELTGEDVTECIGGGLSEEDLSRNYVTACDPRLNYRQAIEMAFYIARKLADRPRPSSAPPPSLRR